MAARPAGAVNVLVEIGYGQGRAGCRDVAAALVVARAVAEAPGLALAGVEAFEGLNQSLPAAEGAARVSALLEEVAAAARAIDAEGLFERDAVVLSVGGSAFMDLVVEHLGAARLSRPSFVLLRSGCYLSHDIGLYERSYADLLDRSAAARALPGRLQNALEVWAYVISLPEPGRAILGAGRRDVGADAGLPKPLKHCRPAPGAQATTAPTSWEVVQLNDQHAHMVFPAGDDVAIGDMIGLGASHPCSTFDRWRLIYLVDEDYAVTGAIQTCF